MDDVIVLITDGEPVGMWNIKQLAMDYAQDLKNRNILIVAAGVGKKSEQQEFQDVLANLATSEDFVVKAQFDKLDSILDKLISKSCIKPGRCFFAIVSFLGVKQTLYFLGLVRIISYVNLVGNGYFAGLRA